MSVTWLVCPLILFLDGFAGEPFEIYTYGNALYQATLYFECNKLVCAVYMYGVRNVSDNIIELIVPAVKGCIN